MKGLTERRDCRNTSPIPKAAVSLPLLGHAIPLMRDQVTTTMTAWRPGQLLDVREVMVKLSLDMLAATVFSGSIDEQAFHQLRRDLSVVMNGVGTRILPPDWAERLPLPANRRFTAARDAVRATIGDAVDQLRASRS
ncbi:hypothetical protein [Streptomyces sp. NBC_00500]|uniref:hypothetical protein n=1 Tax=Streptomyces sp. NBC_00500 TaxID=2975762 RepID=UPI0030E4B2FF